jgi:hypothetical protein
MSTPEQKKNTRLIWFVPVAFIICGVLANVVGDMLFICMIYGPHAYFDEGLRIAKHKPYTLSTGAVLSTNLWSLGWFVDAILWLGFVILFMYALAGISAVFRRCSLRRQ